MTGTIKQIFRFSFDCILFALKGSRAYYTWIIFLLAVMASGFFCWIYQVKNGLAVTSMNDYVSWGFYISNFTFLVGLAAASVMLTLPAVFFKDVDFSKTVLIGEGVAVAALMMCLSLVLIDLGRIDRFWHLLPGIGHFNWPDSMLTWDILVLNGYLALNLLIPFYLLFSHYYGLKTNQKIVIVFMVISVIWAFSIHLVTAFLYAGLPARPYWNAAILGPRFLASAFASGPAFIIIVLSLVKARTKFPVKDTVIGKLTTIAVVAAIINLIMLGSELFKEFYHATEHSHTAFYLYFGLDGHGKLVTWIWTSLIINVLATLALCFPIVRQNQKLLLAGCGALFTAIWMEKGMGLIVPGFIPSPLGEVVEYVPNAIEIVVTAGVWAMGFLILTLLLKIAIAVEVGELTAKSQA